MFLEKDEMKFAILYTLRLYSYPLSLEKLTGLLTWDENVMSYFDLTIMLSELIEDEFIHRLFYKNEECVELTERGRDANEFFCERIPKSIRDRLRDFAEHDGFAEKTDPNGVFGEVIPVARNRYMASLTMMDSGAPILELSIDVGHRAEANRAKEVLKKNAGKIYKYICKTLDADK